MRGYCCVVALLFATVARADTLVVDTSNDSGPGSLRAALAAAAANGEPDTITFSPSMAGQTIQPAMVLPALSEVGTEINGDTDGDGDPDVVIDGSLTPADQNSVGLVVGGDDCTIRGLVINNFWWCQVDAYGGARTTICGCYINTNGDGAAARARDYGEGVRLGGTDVLGVPGRAGRNVICQGLSCGVRVFGRGVLIRNNLVGVKATGDGPFYPVRTGTAIAIGSG